MEFIFISRTQREGEGKGRSFQPRIPAVCREVLGTTSVTVAQG